MSKEVIKGKENKKAKVQQGRLWCETEEKPRKPYVQQNPEKQMNEEQIQRKT